MYSSGAVTSNPYVDENRLEEQFTVMAQAQERIAINSMLHAQHMRISGKHDTFTTRLREQADRMKAYASRKTTSGLKEGLEGKAADSADQYLQTTVKQPPFHNPITSK
jgi:hypothetical protein